MAEKDLGTPFNTSAMSAVSDDDMKTQISNFCSRYTFTSMINFPNYMPGNFFLIFIPDLCNHISKFGISHLHFKDVTVFWSALTE